MWDMATPIFVGGHKVGSIFSGQFFFDDQPVDRQWFAAKARLYGFDEAAYLSALDRVPRLSRAAIDRGTSFLVKLGKMISNLSYSNMELASSFAERNALTDSLHKSEEILNAAQSIANLGSWVLDLQTDSLFWSDEVYRIFGLQPQEFGATYAAFLDAVHPEDRAAVDEAYRCSTREGRDRYEITHRIVRARTGEVRWVHEKCEHTRNSGGAVIRSIGMVQDITERKNAEEELQRNNRELLAVNRTWEEFAFAASHDLREPLRMINIYSQLLLRRCVAGDDQLATQSKRYIEAGVRRMEELIRDLLSFAQANHEEQILTERADLNRSLASALSILQAHIDNGSLQVTSERLPVVNGNERRLAQVFQNLLSNAYKYRKHGHPARIDVSARLQGGEWSITVHDNGIGFDRQYADQIFGLFKRLHANGYEGTGVGLAICRRIVERYGGRIWADSDGVGRGASFTFALAAAQE
jgi:PAS domain S-box-containing protein